MLGEMNGGLSSCSDAAQPINFLVKADSVSRSACSWEQPLMLPMMAKWAQRSNFVCQQLCKGKTARTLTLDTTSSGISSSRARFPLIDVFKARMTDG